MDWDRLSLLLKKENEEQFTSEDYNILIDNGIIDKNEDIFDKSLTSIKYKVVEIMKRYLINMKNEIILKESIKNVNLDNINLLDKKVLNNIASKIPEKNFPTRYKTLLYDNCTNIVYNKLEEHQKVIFNKIHQALSASLSNEDSNTVIAPKILLMDAQPGVGKSFLVRILGHTLNFKDVIAMAITKDLANSLNIPNVIKGITNTKFIKDTFNLPYNEAEILFKKDGEPLSCILKFIYDHVRNYRITKSNLLILDEYSLCSPLFIATLIVAAKVQRFNLLITGDKDQLGAIDKISHHQKTNYELLTNLCTEKYCLTKQIRIKDSQHLALVLKLKEYIKINQKYDNYIPCDFKFKYFIFETYMSKFFSIDPILEAVYISQYHRNLKKRILEMEAYMDKNGIEFRRASFEQKHEGIPSKLLLPPHEKFLPYILLGVGLMYIMVVPNQVSRKIVKLKSISNIILQVEDISDNSILYVNKVPWTKFCHNCSDQQYKWMLECIPKEVSEWTNYPLRPYLSTFHALQGQTFTTENIVVDIDCQTVNSLYVAFSRIENGNQLKHLHSSELISFMFTKYKSDEYYYRIPSIDRESFKCLAHSINNNNKFKFDDTVIQNKSKNVSKSEFESCQTGSFKKIYKSFYNLNTNKRPRDIIEKSITSLTAVAMFLTDNRLFDNHLSMPELLIKYTNYIEANGINVIQ